MAEPAKLGRYELRRVLGKGAMGVVYEGFDPTIGRRVAVKTILKNAAIAEETARAYSALFAREAQAAGRLSHPNIIQVYDFAEERDIAYLVMEFIQGRELRSYFEAQEKFGAAETVRIMGELLDALEFAHQAGVIHRDIKPANIMLDGQRRVKLADFGVARIQESERSAAGTMVGTPAFMSPEQISGGRIDRRTDLFSAGVVFYQLLTGDQPFSGEGAWTVAKKIMETDPPPPSAVVASVSPAYDAIVRKALAKNPAERFASAREFAAALRAAQAPGAPAPAVVQPKPGSRAAPKASDTELEFWRAIQNSADPAEFEFYLVQFPEGTYAQLARHKIARLRELPAPAAQASARPAAVDEDATVAVAGAPSGGRKASLAIPALVVVALIAVGIGVYLSLDRTPAPAPLAQAPAAPKAQTPAPAPPPKAELSAADIEKIRKETEERIRREYADKSAAEQAAAAKAAADKAVQEKQLALKAAAEKAAQDKQLAAKAAAEKAAVDRAAAEKAAAEKMSAERAAAEKASRAAAEKAAEERAAAAKVAEEKAAAKAPPASAAAAPSRPELAGRFAFRLMTGSGVHQTCDTIGFQEDIEISPGDAQSITGKGFSNLRFQRVQDGSVAGSAQGVWSRFGTGEVILTGRATATGYAGTYSWRVTGNISCAGQWSLVRKGERVPTQASAPAKAPPAIAAAAQPPAAPTPREGLVPGRYAFRLTAGSGIQQACDRIGMQEDIEIPAGSPQSISGREFTELQIRSAQDGSIAATMRHGSGYGGGGDVRLSGRASATGYAGGYDWRSGNVTCSGTWTLVRKGERVAAQVPAAAKAPPAIAAAAPQEGVLSGRYAFRIMPGSGGGMICSDIDVQEDIEIRAGGTESISGRLFSDLKLRFAKDGSVTATLWEGSTRWQASDMKLAGRATGTGYAGSYESRAGPSSCAGQWTLVRKAS